MKKTNILIAGIGAVGGYFGGLLAKHYEGNPEVDICFIARGSHLEAIRQNGLQVIRAGTEFTARPALATDNPAEAGLADFIIVATKSYDLEQMIGQLRPCIGPGTVILPLLNGVDSSERIRKLLPETTVADGCVYIVSRLKHAGTVENTGNIETLYFGIDGIVDERLNQLEHIMKQAGVHATLSQNISSLMWEKFVFISPTATATSYFNQTIGELVADSQKFETIARLVDEIKQVAMARHIVLPADIAERSLNKFKAMPFAATSSMHSDYQNKKNQTELETLTGYVLNEGQKYGVHTPEYQNMYTALKQKNAVL